MKIKTTEASGAVLNWMVLKALGHDFIGFNLKYMDAWPYSTDWSQGGPIIDREYIDIAYLPGNCTWVAVADLTDDKFEQYGPTPLIAAMRCYVASKLGAEVEIPNELIGE